MGTYRHAILEPFTEAAHYSELAVVVHQQSARSRRRMDVIHWFARMAASKIGYVASPVFLVCAFEKCFDLSWIKIQAGAV